MILGVTVLQGVGRFIYRWVEATGVWTLSDVATGSHGRFLSYRI